MRKMWPSKQPPATFDHVSQVEQELRARVGDGAGIRDGDGLVVHLTVLHFCASGRRPTRICLGGNSSPLPDDSHNNSVKL